MHRDLRTQNNTDTIKLIIKSCKIECVCAPYQWDIYRNFMNWIFFQTTIPLSVHAAKVHFATETFFYAQKFTLFKQRHIKTDNVCLDE